MEKPKPKVLKITLPPETLEPVFSFVLYAEKDGQLNVCVRWHARRVSLDMIKQAAAGAILQLTEQDFADASTEAQALADETLVRQ